MTNFSKCVLNIKFGYGKVNNKLFKIQVNYNGTIDDLLAYETDKGIFSNYVKEIILPTSIDIVFSGKDNNVDTIVDSEGNIIEDLFVQIQQISLDQFDLNEKFLHQRIVINTNENQSYTTSYIGFNGTVTLNFEEDNIFSQVLALNT